MGQRLFYGKNTPISFQEVWAFDADCPYTVRYKKFPEDDHAPLHVADTAELLLCRGLRGEVSAEGERIALSGDTLVCIPPGMVHAVDIARGEGELYLLQIQFQQLKQFIDLEAMFRAEGRGIGLIVVREAQAVQNALDAVREMIAGDAELFRRLVALVRLAGVLCEHAPAEERTHAPVERAQFMLLRQVVAWTETHAPQEVQLGDAAAAVGFSRNYFCTWFKSLTGTTYNAYLCDVRLMQASRILLETGSVAEACYQSGFRDLSYFIQTFKKRRGCTPKQFLKNLCG